MAFRDMVGNSCLGSVSTRSGPVSPRALSYRQSWIPRLYRFCLARLRFLFNSANGLFYLPDFIDHDAEVFGFDAGLVVWTLGGAVHSQVLLKYRGPPCNSRQRDDN